MEIGSKELNPVRVGDGAGESVKNITSQQSSSETVTRCFKKSRKAFFKNLKNFKIEQLSKIKFYKSILLPICQNILNRCFSRYADSSPTDTSPRTIPRLTRPRWTLPRRTFP